MKVRTKKSPSYRTRLKDAWNISKTKPKPAAPNFSSLLNRKAVKECALDYSNQHRAGKFARVSKAFLERVNRNTRLFIEAEVQRHPSVGKTLQ